MLDDLNHERLARVVQAVEPDSNLLRAWPLKGGLSAEMTALEIERPDGQTSKWIIRQPGASTLQRNPQAAHEEFRLLQVMHELGLATPTPYYLDQSTTILPRPYLVVAYIEGEPDYAPRSDIDFAHQFATHLAAIHGVDSAQLAFLPTQATDLNAIVRERPTQVNRSLQEGQIRDRLEALWPPPQRNAPALLHGDFWPGNVLWREGRIVAVIDWEDAHLGDPLADLAISRLDMLWIMSREAMLAFTQRYQSLMRLDYSHLPYWDLCAALRFVRLAGPDLPGWASFFHPYGRHDISEQSMRDHYRWFVDQALAQLTTR